MVPALGEMISGVREDSQSVLDELRAYFDSLPDDPPAYSSAWPKEILEYGYTIADSASKELQYALLEQGWDPDFTRLINEFDIQDDWLAVEMRIIRLLKYTPGTLFYRRAEQ
ncbi:MAG: hypothetical protein K9M49_09645, partial [Candidatus Marinimicrobia bacterium]|nr:hypothetical protein [Candidatus Neomarinimicrobiota bacterium]